VTDNLHVTLTECPRDAYQGFPKFIPTREKSGYIDQLIAAGVHRIDFGSFVSPKVVPQMKDTAALPPNDDGAAVFGSIAHPEKAYLIGIVANVRGAEGLLGTNARWKGGRRIDAAGYPMSVNETFQKRNTNRDLKKSWEELRQIADMCAEANVDLVGYTSMAFGNPYREPHDLDRVVEVAGRLKEMGATTIQLADTVGLASPEQVAVTFHAVRDAVGDMPLGVHLHAGPGMLREIVTAALDAGCRLFDSAIGGIGGCPFAGAELVGNVDTIALLELLEELGYRVDYSAADLAAATATATEVRFNYGS